MVPSRLREYIGIACNTLMGDADIELEVMVPELLPMLQGSVELDLEPEERQIQLENLVEDGVSSSTVKVTDRVVCEYLGYRSNVSIPNIHIGEQVRVINLGGTSKFYWVPMGRDDNLRKTEHLKVHVANKPGNQDALTDETSYLFEMDTREGQRKVHIRTSKGTDEEVEYDILVDTDASTVHITDSIGNGWKLDSKERHIRTWNETGSFLDMNKENIEHHAVDTYKVTCKHYVLEAEEDIKTETKVTEHESSESILSHTKENTLNADVKDITNTVEQKVTATAKQSVETALREITSPVTTLTGGILIGAFMGIAGGTVPGAPAGPSQVVGDIQHEGNVEHTGDTTQTGSVDIDGDLAVTGNIHGGSVQSDTPFDGPGQTWPDAT